MAEIPARYLVHEVIVEPKTGDGAYGPVFGPAVTRAAMVDEKRQLVRGGDGQEVVSEATLFLRRQHYGDFTNGSRVTLPTGGIGYVITRKNRDDGGRGAWQHLEVTL